MHDIGMVIKRTIITLNSALGANRMKISNRSKLLNYSVGSTAIALLLAVSSAQAVLIDTYEVPGSTEYSMVEQFVEGLFEIEATAWRAKNNDNNIKQQLVSLSKYDLGADAGLGVDKGDDRDDIDNLNRTEWIQLSVTSVTGAITGVNLSGFDTADEVALFGSNDVGMFNQGQGGTWTNYLGRFLGDTNLNPQTFMLDTTGYKYLNVVAKHNQNWNNVSSLRVQGVHVAAVPEPAIIALFGLGLVGMVFARRRQS